MTAPSGWYDDPDDASAQRYWDGENWTPHRQRRAVEPPPPPQLPPPSQQSHWDQVQPHVAKAWDQMQPHVADARGFWSRLPRQRQILFAAAGLLAVVVIGATALMTVSEIGGGSLFGGGPAVAKSALQNDIMGQLRAEMDSPDAVVCADDLPGEVGKTTQCEIQSQFAGNRQVVATVTRVDGGDISYDLAPSFTKEQLEQQVQLQNSQSMLGIGGPMQSVSCDSGLKGIEGDTTRCHYSRNGTHSLTLTVLGVDGMGMRFQLVPDPN